MSSSTRIPHAEPQHAQSAGSLSQAHELDEASTREYLRLIASLHKTWDTLESQSSASVMPQRHMMDAVIAETRHGAQVEMPPTDLGPYSMSEFSPRPSAAQCRLRTRRSRVAVFFQTCPSP